jgi:hypothetical protein
MSAIRTIFPSVTHILCRWHINKNILAKHKKDFATELLFNDFMKDWNIFVQSGSLEEIESNWSKISSKWEESHPLAFHYLLSWFPYFHKFVSFYIDNHKHYGSWTTSRVEGAHAAFKRNLNSSTG